MCSQNVAMVYGKFLVIQTSLICWSSSTGKDHTAEAKIWISRALPFACMKKAHHQHKITLSTHPETRQKLVSVVFSIMVFQHGDDSYDIIDIQKGPESWMFRTGQIKHNNFLGEQNMCLHNITLLLFHLRIFFLIRTNLICWPGCTGKYQYSRSSEF